MDGLEQRRPVADGSRGQQPQGAGNHRSFVGDDVAEHVLGQDHVELARVEDDLHGRVVHEQEIEGHAGVLGGYALHGFAPEPGGFQHVGLIDEGELVAAGFGSPEGPVGNAQDFVAVVGAVVVGAGAVLGAALFAEVNTARQLPVNEDVGALNALSLEGRVGQQLVVGRDGANVGV